MVGYRSFRKLQYTKQIVFDTVIMRMIYGGELQHYKYVFFPESVPEQTDQRKQEKTIMYRNACNYIVLHSFKKKQRNKKSLKNAK